MSARSDLSLLRRFEPVVRYTKGERFFPMDVEPYVRSCSLWAHRPDDTSVCLVPEGKLSLERLAEPRADEFGTVHYLKFIDPLNLAQLASYKLEQSRAKRRADGDVFRAGRGRLARVGYVPRLLDVLFSLTLLARGRVPGDTAAAAAVAYERMFEGERRHCYYGRVVRQDGWTVLQYWFFYPFNNWRSGFFGLNDHEADWEMACVYLYERNDGEHAPEWVAYASHDYHGDDLRRRWDDPELERVGEHPVIYAGAGSHASYYAPGEYLAEIELRFLSPALRAARDAQRLWHEALKQYRNEDGNRGRDFGHVFRVPFVDYARGDGVSIGPGGERGWDEVRLLDPTPGWAANYRGLWGLYARDPISGENAPAGPVYERDGTVRRSWFDPVGWAGLDKVRPPNEELTLIAGRREELEARCARLSAKAEEESRRLAELGSEAEAMRGNPHLARRYEEHEKEISAAAERLKETRAGVASDRLLIEALKRREERLRAGDRGSPRAHIRRAHQPASDTELRFDRLAETWAAVSIGLVMVGFVALVLFAREYLVLGLVALVSLLVFIESGFRRRLSRLTARVTVGLAVVSALVLLYEFFWPVVILAVLAAGTYMMWENLRELWT